MLLYFIKSDLYRYQGKPFTWLNLFKGMRAQGFRYMFFRRIRDHYGKSSIWGLLASLFVRRYMYKYGFQIGGMIGPGFYIGHFGTIVVSTLTTIGSNCNIAHGVTIGATRRGAIQGAPSIGSKVWIGANAIIVGKINIGDNVLIAPGAFVNTDVPSNSIVVGNPAHITHKPEATIGYINNLIA